MITFQEWLIKEGLWLSDDKAEETPPSVDAKRRSKPTKDGSMGGAGGGGMMGGAAPMGGAMGGGGMGGLSLPPTK